MVGTISSSTFIKDQVNYFRDLLRENLIDPNNRSPVNGISGVQFVRTHWPERLTDYPTVTVAVNVNQGIPTGQQLSTLNFDCAPEIRVWTQSVKQRDEITDQIIKVLNLNCVSGTFPGIDLYGVQINRVFDLNEPGKDGIKQKIIQLESQYMQTS